MASINACHSQLAKIFPALQSCCQDSKGLFQSLAAGLAAFAIVVEDPNQFIFLKPGQHKTREGVPCHRSQYTGSRVDSRRPPPA